MQNETTKFINGLNNYFFKKIFGTDIDKVRQLIEIVTKKKINGEYSYLIPTDVSGKETKAIEADVIVEVKNEDIDSKVLIDVEPQKYSMGNNLIKRQIHYASNYYSGMYEKSNFYKGERRFIEIYLHHGYLNNGNPLSITQYTRYPENVSYDIILIYDVYIDEFLKFDLQNVEDNDKILVELMQSLGTDKITKYINSKFGIVREVAKLIKTLNQSETERILAIKREQNETREEFNLIAAKAEGIAEGKKEVIQALYQSGLSVEELSKRLNINIDEVKRIVNIS